MVVGKIQKDVERNLGTHLASLQIFDDDATQNSLAACRHSKEPEK